MVESLPGLTTGGVRPGARRPQAGRTRSHHGHFWVRCAPMVCGSDRDTGVPRIIHVAAANPAARLRLALAAASVLVALALGAAAPARAESPPLATTGTATETGFSSATLSGTVSSVAALQGCWFEWGIAPGFEASVPCQLGPAEGSFVSAGARATGLLSGTAYGWRLAASNAAGVAHGSTATLATTGFPEAEASVESTEATLIQGLPGSPPPDPGPAAHPRVEDGLYVAYCRAAGEPDSELSPLPRANEAMANHTGWPSVECLKMDKGTYGKVHTLIGLASVHNYLLG